MDLPKVVRAVVLPCGSFGSFRGEAYHFSAAWPASGVSVFYVLRWVVDWLGGNRARNFLGDSVHTWRGWIAQRLRDDRSDGSDGSRESQSGSDEEDEDIPHENAPARDAEEHLLSSSWSEVTRSRGQKDHGTEGSEEEEQAPAIPRRDFCVSTFGLVVLLLHWIVRGPRANSKWNLSKSDLASRCRALLQGLSDRLWQGEAQEEFDPGERTSLVLRVSDGNLDARALVASPGGVKLKKLFGKKQLVSIPEALVLLAKDEINRNLSPARRSSAQIVLTDLLLVLGKVVERGRSGSVWSETKVESLEQLRTSV